MKTKFISLKQLKMHEFETTLRRLKREERLWPRKSEILAAIYEKSAKSFGRLAGQLILSYLIVSTLSSGSQLALKIQEYDISLPLSYFLAATSILYLFATVSFNHFSTALSLKIRADNQILLPGFSSETFNLLQERGEIALGIPIFQNEFIKERLPVSHILSNILLLAFLSLLAPFIAFGAYFLIQQLNIIVDGSTFFWERLACFFGVFGIFASWFNLVLFHVPLPVQKNIRGIRWGFLVYLHPPLSHPQANRWLDQRD